MASRLVVNWQLAFVLLEPSCLVLEHLVLLPADVPLPCAKMEWKNDFYGPMDNPEALVKMVINPCVLSIRI